MHGSNWVAVLLSALVAGVAAAALGVAVPAAPAATPVATVPVVGSPIAVTIDPAGAYVYASGSGTIPANDNLARIDVATGAVTNFTIPTSSRDLAIDPAGTYAYIVHYGGSAVSKIALATGSVVASIPVGMGPQGIAIDPAGTFAYVTHLETMSKIALSTFTVVKTIPVTWPAGKVTIDPAGAFAYVVSADQNNGYTGTLTKVNLATATVAATIPVSPYPTGVAVDPAGRFAYVVHHRNPGIVSKVDLAANAVVATYTVGREPLAIALDPSGAFAFTGDYNGGTLSRLDLASGVVASVPVAHPWGLAVDRSGAFAYVANQLGNGTVSKVDLTVTPQTITWNPTTAVSAKASPITLTSATTTGDGAITFAVTDPGSTGCSITRTASDTVLMFNRAGSCVVAATAAATFSHPAATKTSTFIVTLEPAVVTWNPALPVRADFSPQTFAAATTTSGAIISYAVTSPGTTGCAIPAASAPVLAFTGPGSCTITATSPALGVYAEASTVRTFTITPVPAVTATVAAPTSPQTAATPTVTVKTAPTVVTARARPSSDANGKSVQVALSLPRQRSRAVATVVLQIYRPATARARGTWITVGSVVLGRDGTGVLKVKAKPSIALVKNGAKVRLVAGKSLAVVAVGTFRVAA